VFLLSATIIASFFGGNSIVTFTALIYQFGAAAFWGYIGVATGFVIIFFLSKRIKGMADKGGFYTFADYFKKKFGRNTGRLVALVVFLIYIGYLVVQFIAGGTILSVITGWPYFACIILMGVVVVAYVSMGGFRAVVMTDAFQYIVIVTLLTFVTFSFLNGRTLKLSAFNPLIGAVKTLPFFFYGIITTILGAELWQRIYAGSSVRVIKTSLIISAVVSLFLGFLMTLIALSVKSKFPDILPQSAAAVGFSQMLPSGVLGLGLVVLFAAIMSTIDTFIFLLAVSFSRDFFSIPPKQIVKATRINSMAIGGIAMVLAIFFSNIVNVMVVIGSVLFSLFPAVIGSFMFRLKPIAVIASIISAVLASIGAIAVMGFNPELAVVPISVGVLALILFQVAAPSTTKV
jgi:Na+/proline symporter